MFLGKTLYSHSASLHPGVWLGTSKLTDGGSRNDSRFMHGNRDKLQPEGPLLTRMEYRLYVI